MSSWAHIFGTLVVSPFGRNQAEMTFVLDTVLSHLPRVTGSEEDMHVHFFPEHGCTLSTNYDEFDIPAQYYPDRDGRCWHRHLQLDYLVTVEGALRDRNFARTHREFVRWMSRLAKRVFVTNYLVSITSTDRWGEKPCIISKKPIVDDPFAEMYEPSWKGGWVSRIVREGDRWRAFVQPKYEEPQPETEYLCENGRFCISRKEDSG